MFSKDGHIILRVLLTITLIQLLSREGIYVASLEAEQTCGYGGNDAEAVRKVLQCTLGSPGVCPR